MSHSWQTFWCHEQGPNRHNSGKGLRLPTCQGVDDCARAYDKRAGYEEVVDEKEIEENLLGNRQ